MSCHKNKQKKLYLELKKKQKQIQKQTPTYLYQKDFDEGTYLLDKSGYYILAEDIVFDPNPDVFPLKYNTPAFSLGYFAVLAISADDVYLNLNGYSISASEEFALQQRFFSIIELANSPFVPSQGPSDFTTPSTFKAANNVFVRKGKLGRSSHHGIHGNMATNVLLEKLKVTDFEFIGVALNGGENIVTHKIDIYDNKQDIPVLATYSAARFAVKFSKMMLNNTSLSNSQKVELTKRMNNLQIEMDKTFSQVMKTGKTSSKLFRNETGLPDGNCYGLLIKNRGVAVNEYEYSGEKVNNVLVRKTFVNNIQCRVDEIIGLSQKDGSGVQNDVAGSVLQIYNLKDKNGKYKSTLLSELQLYLAELSINLNMPIGKINITQDVIDWSKNGSNISTLLSKGYVYKCGGDSMNHLNKSAIGFRFDALNDLRVEKCGYYKIKNSEFMEKGVDQYHKKHDTYKRKRLGVIGVNISYCSNVDFYKFKGKKLFSKHGDAVGMNIIFVSQNVKLDHVKLCDIKAGYLDGCKWLGQDYDGRWVKYKNKPIAIGIRYENNSISQLKDIDIYDLYSCQEPVKILKV